MKTRLSGKSVLVTGGESGIGRAIVLRCLNEGASVVIAGINEEDISKTISDAEADGAKERVSAIVTDVTNSEQVQNAIDLTINNYGRLDAAIANAGAFCVSTPFGEWNIDEWERVINVNLTGVFYVLHAAAKVLVSQGEGGSGDGSSDGGNTISDEELQDMLDSDSVTPSENLSNDDGSDSVELSDRQKKMLENHFKKQEKFLDGDVQKTQLSKKDNKDIKSIEESGATYENVGNDIPKNYWSGATGNGTKCLVVRKLTQSLIDSDQFSCASSWNQRSYGGDDSWRSREYNFVEEGLRLGSVLGRKLQVRGEESSLKYSRQDTGKIDKRLIAELGFGNSNVFSQTFVDTFPDAFLHISVDASGSMGGSKWTNTMKSVVAMTKAIDMIEGVDVVVSFRSTQTSSGRGRKDNPLMLIAYDSRKDSLVKVKTLFKYLQPSGTTPEGLCYEAIMNDIVPSSNDKDSYFLNFSDGMPMFQNDDLDYYNSTATNHTKKMVKDIRSRGIKVLSYFVGDSDYDRDRSMNDFKQMYGKDSQYIDITSVTAVSRIMNKKFLEKN